MMGQLLLPQPLFISRHMSCIVVTKSSICGATGGSCSAILSHLVSGNSPLLKGYFPSGLPQATFIFLNVCRQGLICHVNPSCLHGLICLRWRRIARLTNFLEEEPTSTAILYCLWLVKFPDSHFSRERLPCS